MIGPCLANFCLDGLEKLIIPSCSKFLCKEKFLFLKSKASNMKSGFDLREKAKVYIVNRYIRYADDFVVLSNSEDEAYLLRTKILSFLKVRGLFCNLEKSVFLRFIHNSKFEILGFTFHLIIFPKRDTRITRRVSKKGQIIRSRKGLFIYPSSSVLRAFKLKIKVLLHKLRNAPPVLVIRLLNPIIIGWANYFAVSTTIGGYVGLDHFLFQRCFKYIKKKFPRMNKTIRATKFFVTEHNESKGKK